MPPAPPRTMPYDGRRCPPSDREGCRDCVNSPARIPAAESAACGDSGGGRMHVALDLTILGLVITLEPLTLVAFTTAGDWLTLVLFCLLATSSFLAMEAYAAFTPEAASARLEQVQKWINAYTDQAIVVLSLVVGCWLLGDSLYLIVS